AQGGVPVGDQDGQHRQRHPRIDKRAPPVVSELVGTAAMRYTRGSNDRGLCEFHKLVGYWRRAGAAEARMMRNAEVISVSYRDSVGRGTAKVWANCGAVVGQRQACGAWCRGLSVPQDAGAVSRLPMSKSRIASTSRLSLASSNRTNIG